ncbi:hypothetical protein CI610_03397 [invertebrate metagenome]|uniref:Uncharacterized protein n=1 Tax=invertebrate metagenome TaxID=1711999 RepID=A0A2H9T371_9ZZZZ
MSSKSSSCNERKSLSFKLTMELAEGVDILLLTAYKVGCALNYM